jgi:hypothetical protein
MKSMVLSVGVGLLCLTLRVDAFAVSCDRLTSLSFPDATVTLARQFAAGAFAPEKPIPMVARQLEGLPAVRSTMSSTGDTAKRSRHVSAAAGFEAGSGCTWLGGHDGPASDRAFYRERGGFLSSNGVYF